MATVIKVYTERHPLLRLIGRRYSDEDRGPDGGFANVWNVWFDDGRFEVLERLRDSVGGVELDRNDPEAGASYVAYMRFVGDTFEYWVGMLFPDDTAVPDGYMSVDVEPAAFGVCWIHGRDDTGELYGPEAFDMCRAKIESSGWQMAPDAWCFERYHPSRFMTPDEAGKVILDFGIQLRA